jgi:hypothetical protein
MRERDGAASMRPIKAQWWGSCAPIGKGAKPGERDSDFSTTLKKNYKKPAL